MKLARIVLIVAAMSPLGALPCMAEAYLYRASCLGSYSKQGPDGADLTKAAGRAIACDYVMLDFTANGHILVQLGQKKSSLTPLGFAGDGLDYNRNPNFATLPVKRIYLPHVSQPGTTESVAGADGFCFIGGSINIRHLVEVVCVTKIEIGTDKLIYHVNARIDALGQPVPGL